METVDVDETVTWELNISLKSEECLAPNGVDGPEHLHSSCLLIYPLLERKKL